MSDNRGATRRFLSLEQVAEELGVDPPLVGALIKGRELRAIQVGAQGPWRVGTDDLEDYIAHAYKKAHTTSSGNEATLIGPISQQIVNLVTAERKRQGLTQQEIADRMGAAVSWVQAIEYNKQHGRQVSAFQRYTDALGVKLEVSIARRFPWKQQNPDTEHADD